MMQKISLTLSTKLDLYLLDNYKGSIAFLHYFFTDMPLQNIPTYIDWVLEEKIDTSETNSTWLKKEPPYLFLGSQFSDRKDKGPYFKILIPEFVKLLTEWEKLVKAKPKQIIITQSDDGIITIKDE